MMTYYSIAPNGGILKEIDRDVDVEAIGRYQAYMFGYYAKQEGRKLGNTLLGSATPNQGCHRAIDASTNGVGGLALVGCIQSLLV